MNGIHRLRLLRIAVAVCMLSGFSNFHAFGESQQFWTPTGLSGGGGMFSPAISAVDPNLMMINCDMSAAYISSDGGHNWTMINHAQLRSDTRCCPGFDPTDADVIYASSGGTLKVSHDRGRTFSPLGKLRQSVYGCIVVNPCDPNVIIVGTRDSRASISRDRGLTWTTCDGPRGSIIGFHFDRTSGGRVIFAAFEEGIWRSDDGGVHWRDCCSSLPWKKIQGFAGGSNASTGQVIIYCTIESRDENNRFKGGVYVSRDRGLSWKSAMGDGINLGTKKLDQWSYGPISQYTHVMTTDTAPETVYVTNTSTGFYPPNSESVYRSDDAGGSWRATFFIDPRFKEYNVAPNYGTASTGQSYKGGDAPFAVAICDSDPNRVLITWSRCYITHNGGKSWFNGDTYPAPGSPPGPRSRWICNGLVVTTTWHYYLDPFEHNRRYITYTDIGLARSTDSDATWMWWDKNSWAPWRNTCYEIAFDPEIPGKMWGAFSDVHDIPNDNIISERHGHNRPGGVCISTDFGASWKNDCTGLPARPVTSIVVDPKSKAGHRTLYAGVFMEGVYKSTDDGKTWVLKKNGLGNPLNMRVYRVILHRDGTLFASICAKRMGSGKAFIREGAGLYRSRDGGETWYTVTPPGMFLYPKDFSVDADNSSRILLGACDTSWQDQSGGLYMTEDGGENWKRIGRQGRQTFGGYFHPKHPDWIYMTLTEEAPGAGLWLSQDDGKTWKPFDELPFSNIQRVAFDPSDDSTIHVTTFGGSVWKGPAVPGSAAR